MQLATSPLVRQNLQILRSEPVVFIVDDDVSVRESLELLVSTAGWRPETFASAAAFLLEQDAWGTDLGRQGLPFWLPGGSTENLLGLRNMAEANRTRGEGDTP